MIKISHVMTIYTNVFCVLCITTFYTYTTLYKWSILYMYCKLNKSEFYWTCQQFIFFVSFSWNKWIWCYVNKTEANLASTKVLAARCVRVIHAQCVLQFALLSRTLLRSSSNNEPSDPPYRIIFFFLFIYIDVYRFNSYSMTNNNDFVEWKGLQQVIVWSYYDLLLT